MDTEAREQPASDEGTDNADNDVTDKSEPVPRTIWPANQPAIRPTNKITRRLSTDMLMPSESRNIYIWSYFRQI